MPQSNAFNIVQAIGSTLQTTATAEGAAFAMNPALPLDSSLASGRTLFVLHRGDKLNDQPGQRKEKRTLRVVVGAWADTSALADALLFAGRCAVRTDGARTAMRGVDGGVLLREVEVEAELKEVSTTGTVLLSAYEIEYFQTYPNAA